MQLPEIIARRRMVRSFDGSAPSHETLAKWAELALLAPTAGNSAGVRLVVIEGGAVADYFAAATDQTWRSTAQRSAGLQRAGAVVAAFSCPSLYTARYGESDKATSGLSDVNAWTVPYWHTDAAMAVMQLLLLIEHDEWSACFWGNFRNEPQVRDLCELSDEWQLFGTVLIGNDDGNDRQSASLRRDVSSRAQRVTWLSRAAD